MRPHHWRSETRASRIDASTGFSARCHPSRWIIASASQSLASTNRFVIFPYASIRRSRRNGQCVRLNSTFSRSHGTTMTSSLSTDARLHDLPVRARDEALAPELDAVLAHRLAVGAEDLLQADAVRGADVAAVGDGVAALDQFPRLVLGLAVLCLLATGASRWRWGRRGSRRPGARSGGRLRGTTGPSRSARRSSRTSCPRRGSRCRRA